MSLDKAFKTNAATSVLTGSTSIAAANPNRTQITLCNDHASQVVYLSLGPVAAVANQGIRLNPVGGSYTTTAYTGEIRGISVGGTSVVTWAEI